MPVDDLERTLETETTRRTVVKTGAKLAYAAPLVAATFKLSATGAGAQAASPVVCRAGDGCDNIIFCGDGSQLCGCVTTAESAACVGNVGCPAADECASSDQCDPGFVCVSALAACCTFAVCAPECASGFAASAVVGASLFNR